MKFKIVLLFIAFYVSAPLIGQEIKELTPDFKKPLDFSDDMIALWSRCDSLMFGLMEADSLSQEDYNILLDHCDELGYSEACEGMYGVICGCSWYCGAMYSKVSVSSHLANSDTIRYDEKSISDLNYYSAWVEGVEGHGIGETITFEFAPMHPRITEIIIANGYVKDQASWKNNARVKKLKVSVNGSPFAILNLKDECADQHFKVPTIGYAHREHIKYNAGNEPFDEYNMVLVKPSIITFEIVEVYPGEKYQDTVISEIYFDGIDVH